MFPDWHQYWHAQILQEATQSITVLYLQHHAKYDIWEYDIRPPYLGFTVIRIKL